VSTYQCDCDRNHGPEYVGQHRERAAASAADDEKLDRVEASPPTLSLRVDASCYSMSIVIVVRKTSRLSRLPTIAASGMRGNRAWSLLRGVLSRMSSVRGGDLSRRPTVGMGVFARSRTRHDVGCYFSVCRTKKGEV
jgi:hypothetical protein